MTFETILYEEDGPLGIITLNRPDDGNMFTETMRHEIRDRGLARVMHDRQLRLYLDSREAKELSASFREKRKPDPDTFGH